MKVLESTGDETLDHSVVYSFYRWRFKAGEVVRAIMPVTFTMDGRRSPNPYR